MKILITGATGFLGSHLCHRFVRDGHEVTIFRRSTSNVAPLKGLDLNHVIGDIADAEAVNRAVKGQDMVVHTAAHLAYWGHQREVQTRVNVEGAHNVVRSCKRFGVKRLLHVSSISAIGIPYDADCPADETFSFNLGQSNLNYHLSKHLAEKEVLKETYDGLDAVIVNPGWIFGPFGSSFRGGDIIDKVRRSRVVPYFRSGICAVHVDDVVEGILNALRQGRKGERYILGGENVSFRRVIEIAAERLGLQRMPVPVPSFVTGLAATMLEPIGKLTGRRPYITYDTHYCANRFHFYDSSKSRRELGYNPRSFVEIVDDYLAWSKDSAYRASSKNLVNDPETPRRTTLS